jgi:hypothetical protein
MVLRIRVLGGKLDVITSVNAQTVLPVYSDVYSDVTDRRLDVLTPGERAQLTPAAATAAGTRAPDDIDHHVAALREDGRLPAAAVAAQTRPGRRSERLASCPAGQAARVIGNHPPARRADCPKRRGSS